jgi:hypothetical protein
MYSEIIVFQTTGIRSPTEEKYFFSSVCVQTSLRHTERPIQWEQGVSPGGKARPGREADHSPPSSVEVKNEKELYLFSLVAFLAVAGQLYFYCLH